MDECIVIGSGPAGVSTRSRWLSAQNVLMLDGGVWIEDERRQIRRANARAVSRGLVRFRPGRDQGGNGIRLDGIPLKRLYGSISPIGTSRSSSIGMRRGRYDNVARARGLSNVWGGGPAVHARGHRRLAISLQDLEPYYRRSSRSSPCPPWTTT